MTTLGVIAIGIIANASIILVIRLAPTIADQFYRAGRAIIETGIEPKGIRAFGQPYVDTPRSQLHGEIFVLGSYFWRFAPNLLKFILFFVDLWLVMLLLNIL